MGLSRISNTEMYGNFYERLMSSLRQDSREEFDLDFEVDQIRIANGRSWAAEKVESIIADFRFTFPLSFVKDGYADLDPSEIADARASGPSVASYASCTIPNMQAHLSLHNYLISGSSADYVTMMRVRTEAHAPNNDADKVPVFLKVPEVGVTLHDADGKRIESVSEETLRSRDLRPLGESSDGMRLHDKNGLFELNTLDDNMIYVIGIEKCHSD
jgi:hypothetical protein